MRAASLSVVALVAVLGSLAFAPAALAADPTFGAATATATFGQSVDVTQPATLPAGIKRVEALVRTGGDAHRFLATIPNPGTGDVTLRYSFETPLGGLYPNTPVELGFRVTFDDDRVVDGPTTTVLYADDRFQWKTLEGKILRVHWYQGDSGFGQRALDIGEKGVENATKLLGVTETAPIDFYIYASRDPFYDVIGQAVQENVGGLAQSSIRTLFANIPPSTSFDPWVGLVVPHELTHIVFNTATQNAYHSPLHWLNEGLADYLAIGYDAGARANVERAARTGDLLPLHALVAQFPSPSDLFSLAYDESVSAIDFLVRTYGRDALVALIRGYAKGVSDDEAFTTALGVDTAKFEAAWLADLGADVPVPYGPKPAPSGPLPPGWAQGPGSTAGPSASGPVPTTRPSNPAGTTDPVGPILLGIVIALALVLVAGLVVSMRRLNRGEPLLAMPGAVMPPPDAVPEATPDPAPEPAPGPVAGDDATDVSSKPPPVEW
jgi:Peptidase MA superfamily